MPLELLILPSFERSFKLLDPAQKDTVRRLLEATQAYFLSNGNLTAAQRIAPRFLGSKPCTLSPCTLSPAPKIKKFNLVLMVA